MLLPFWVREAMDEAAAATYDLGALQAVGLLPGHVPASTGHAILRLHRAAKAGSTEALMALADRFMRVSGRHLWWQERGAKKVKRKGPTSLESRWALSIPSQLLLKRRQLSGGGAARGVDKGTHPIGPRARVGVGSLG